MGKQFKIITVAKSNEVSLCSKYNSGANKQTEFELIKDKEGSQKLDLQPVLKSIFESVEMEENIENGFKDFIEYWLEYDVNNCFYNLLNDALEGAIRNIQYSDSTKEQKTEEYKKLFNEFVEMYNTLPITKTQDGTYEVSLASSSRIQDAEAHPQNETSDITKEKTSDMEEQMNLIEKAFEMIKSAFSLNKTETPAEEPQEVQAEQAETPAEEAPAEEAPVEEAEVETPVVEQVEEPVEAPAEEEVEAPVESEVETPAEEEPVEEEAQEEVAKTSEEVDVQAILKKASDLEAELAEIKKAKEENEIKIEKMSFVQKAKDDYSNLVGTPEEIGDKLYSISKSNLDESIKDYVFEQLKKISESNSEMTEEVGSITKGSGDMTDEDIAYAKAEEIAKTKGISLKKALREVK